MSDSILASLERTHEDIRQAGCVPNSKFYAAMRAAKACSLKRVQTEPGTDYRVTSYNGREFTVFVPKTSDVFKECRIRGIEIQSFVKLAEER
jgi:hypothetical protein